MEIPDIEVTGVGVTVDISGTPSPLFLNGKKWHLGLSDVHFEEYCVQVSNKAISISSDLEFTLTAFCHFYCREKS